METADLTATFLGIDSFRLQVKPQKGNADRERCIKSSIHIHGKLTEREDVVWKWTGWPRSTPLGGLSQGVCASRSASHKWPGVKWQLANYEHSMMKVNCGGGGMNWMVLWDIFFNWTFGLLQTVATLITGWPTLASMTLIGQSTHLSKTPKTIYSMLSRGRWGTAELQALRLRAETNCVLEKHKSLSS